MVYFDDLYWRSAGTLGQGTKFLPENDTGPDDAVHAQEGIYILYDPPTGEADGGTRHHRHRPTVLDRLGIAVPSDMKGKVIGW